MCSPPQTHRRWRHAEPSFERRCWPFRTARNSPGFAKLLVDVEVVVEIVDHAIDAQAGRIGVAMKLQRVRDVERIAILLAAQKIGLDRRIFRPAADAEHAAVDPVLPVRSVELIWIANHRPHQEIVDVPVIVLLADLDAKAVEIVGRVAELILGDQSACRAARDGSGRRAGSADDHCRDRPCRRRP